MIDRDIEDESLSLQTQEKIVKCKDDDDGEDSNDYKIVIKKEDSHGGKKFVTETISLADG